jgi:hypothetical protein
VVDERKAAVFSLDAFGVLPHFFFPGLLEDNSNDKFG